jgi:hypothetical protein
MVVDRPFVGTLVVGVVAEVLVLGLAIDDREKP